MADPTIIQVVNEVGRGGVLHGRTFENALLRGPAVLMPFGKGMAIESCSIAAFGGNLDAVFIPLPEGSYNGFVGVDGCVFRNCAFENIAFAATPEVIEILKGTING